MKKHFFITGGTGSFAKKFVQLVLQKKLAKKITIFSRDEFKQMIMKDLPLIKKMKSYSGFILEMLEIKIDYDGL